MRNERGFVLLLTFGFMIVLVQMVAALTVLLGGETLDIGAQRDDKQILYLADAGVQRALRELRNTNQTGVAHLRGATTINSGASNHDNLRYEEDGNAVLNQSGDFVDLRVFDSNYTNARITKVELAATASHASGGTAPTLTVSYSTTGTFPQAGNTSMTMTSSSAAPYTLTTSLTDFFIDVTSDRTWDWTTLMGASATFTLRAERSGGNRNVNVDQLFLRVTYEIDTPTEAWFTGTYQTYPFALGAGTVQSVSITDEQAKIHVNTASQTLLNNLFVELGIASGTASTLAANINTYKGTKNFDSIEELQQVTGMTGVLYNTVKDYLTVYPLINTNAYSNTVSPRTTKVNRVPVNINTASRQVLEAIFNDSSLGLDSGEPATLATDIINARTTAPFTCFYNRNSSITTDFYEFMRNETFLSNAERNNVIDNADPSALIPVEGFSGYTGNNGTEFCYASSAYKVESLADVGGRKVRVKTILSNQGANTFTTYASDTSSTGYRKENFE